jgi:hypothetical protein
MKSRKPFWSRVFIKKKGHAPTRGHGRLCQDRTITVLLMKPLKFQQVNQGRKRTSGDHAKSMEKRGFVISNCMNLNDL